MSGPATVVVSRSVVPGREQEFGAWVRRLRAAAERADGYLGGTFEPPGDAHPGEWLIVYRFATSDHLQRWLTSEARTTLVEEGDDLVAGMARQQVVIEPGTDPATLVSSIRLRPGTEGEYRRVHEHGMAVAQRAYGLLRSELHPPTDSQPEMTALLTFASRTHLDAWVDSDERRRLLAAMTPLTLGARTVNVVGSFAGWFHGGGGTEPKRWKQAAAVVMALVPVSLVFSMVRAQVAPSASIYVAVPLGAVFNVTMMTWVIMPWLTRRLSGWLGR